MSGKIMLTNPGGYAGSSFLLVDAVVKQLIEAGQTSVAATMNNVHQKSSSNENIMAELKRFTNF
jgi:hypothetical protein